MGRLTLWLAGNAACSTNGQILVPLKSPGVLPESGLQDMALYQEIIEKTGSSKIWTSV